MEIRGNMCSINEVECLEVIGKNRQDKYNVFINSEMVGTAEIDLSDCCKWNKISDVPSIVEMKKEDAGE